MSRLAYWLDLSAGLLLFAVLIYLPIAFGGVHPVNWLAARTAIFLALAALLLRDLLIGRSWLSPTIWSSAKLLCLPGAYLLLQFLYLSLRHNPHPVFGSVVAHPDWLGGLNALVDFFFFCAALVSFGLWLAGRPKRAQLLRLGLLAMALITSLIALSHWFYDSGKLFGIFEPNLVFVSRRARWPFVNANHLAHFLLIPFFFLLTSWISVGRSVLQNIDERPGRNSNLLSRIAASKRLQGKLFWLVLLFGALLSTSLAILASLSRGSWLATAVGLCFVYFGAATRAKSGSQTQMPQPAPSGPQTLRDDAIDVSPHPDLSSTSQHRRQRRSRKHSAAAINYGILAKRALKPIFMLCVAGLVYLFLSGQGEELLGERIEYGLLHSKSDLRFELYRSSAPLFLKHPFFGIGLGTWSELFPQTMSAQMSGVNPVYMHSDPLQFLIATGLVGATLALIAILLIVRMVVRNLALLEDDDFLTAVGLLAGFAALFLASCVDFPFRIPAIVLYLAAYLALILALIEPHESAAPRS